MQPMSTLTFPTALDLFSACHTPVDCFYLFRCTNSCAWTLDDLAILARACVFKMYYTRLLTLNCLKTMLLFSGSPSEIMRTGENLRDGMRAWIEKVGPQSSYWCSIGFFTRVSEMYNMSPDDLSDQFKFGSYLDEETCGVMELFFVASCFKSPVTVNMGMLFWVFAREMIRVRISDVDQLNALLWGQLLSQTILVLDPVVFALDCLLPGIDVVLSIEGTTSDPSLSTDGTKRKPVIMVPSNTSLVFYNSARLSSLDIQRLDVPNSQRRDSVFTFKGMRGDRREVRIADMSLIGGGVSIDKYDFVRCTSVSVSNSDVGVSVKNVRDFYFGGGYRSSREHFVAPRFVECDLAMSFKTVCRVICEEMYVSRCKTVFKASVSDDFLVRRATFDCCKCLGEVLMTPGLYPLFYETMFGNSPHTLSSTGMEGAFIASKAIYRLCGAMTSTSAEEG